MTSGALRAIAPPNGIVDEHPIQDLSSLAYSDTAKTLYLLDRSGALFGWDMAGRWWLEREAGNDSDFSQEYPVELVSDAQFVYLLDTNNGSIWKRTDKDWVTLVRSQQLEGGIRMAAAGDLYILVGERPGHDARLMRLRGTALSVVKVNGGMEQPTLISAGPGNTLLLVDRGFRRVRVLDPQANTIREIVAGSDADVLALAVSGDNTVLLGSDWLVSIRGQLPDQLGLRPTPPSAQILLPNNLALLEKVQQLRMPITAAHLPDIDRSLPGAPRLYRFGIHEGIDMYSSTVGVNVVKGTPIRAAADGVVTRADVEYKEASVAENRAWEKEARDKRITPPAIQDRLGGRQVWIDHGDSLGTRYLHLSGIAPGIKVGSTVKAGAIIGYAGNSGTSEAAAGSNSGIHLHFEIRVGDGYLGQWLSPIETRRELEKLLALE
jgi:murein DD-endopeptidase MepM/ murein hydrolase activator NlpD